jgi:hypothetical protein
VAHSNTLDSLYIQGQIRFIHYYSTQGGRCVAKRLNLSGKGSEEIAGNLSGFFWNLQAANTVQSMNEWKRSNGSNCYVNICLIIYNDIKKNPQYINLPEWVINDVETSIRYLKTLV